MTDANMNPKVDEFISKEEKWRDEFIKLRAIILGCGLKEELKWGVPCYTLEGSNIVLIHGFKEYCAILFIKGALLKDEKGILVRQTANVQAGRQVRFTSAAKISGMEDILKDYIHEAVEIEKAGLEVDFKRVKELAIPEEFESRLRENPELKNAFESLTPGRQRAYILHFSGAKQSKTREARIEKYIQQILSGKGMDD